MAARFDTRIVSVAVEQGASPQVRSATLAAAARAGVAELIRSGQAAPKYTRFVDGTEGASEDQVRPDGTIAYRFSYMGEVVQFALDTIRERSPVGTGRYRDSFMVSVNGRPIKAMSVNPEHVPDDAEIFIYNTQPYSRKLDVQVAGGRKLRISVSPGMFDDTARAVNARFGNYIRASRRYTLQFPGQKTTKAGRKIDYPALEISRR